jgi:hypothetical protein
MRVTFPLIERQYYHEIAGVMEASMSNTNVVVAPPEQKTTLQRPIRAILHHIGPVAGLAIALIATVAWIGLLAYGLIKLL